MNKVLPKVYLIGFSQIDIDPLIEYLRDTDQTEFLVLLQHGRNQKLSDGEILCSFYAKLCYKTLVEGKNANVSKIRGISDNFESIIRSGHGAVLEHFNLNFVVTNCSRIFTHEQVRHRVGIAYSQTSGRYVALGVDQNENPVDIDMIIDPILEPVLYELELGLDNLMSKIRLAREKLNIKNMPFDLKKKYTSALRRFAPNGQANEIGITINLRSLRNIIEQRTSRHAEWEIRYIYNQIANIIHDKWPDLLFGGNTEQIEGLWEWTKLKI